MAEHCSCAGNFTETVKIEDFKELLVTFRNIAEYVNVLVLVLMNGCTIVSHYYTV